LKRNIVEMLAKVIPYRLRYRNHNQV